jgi:hypothetical protein
VIYEWPSWLPICGLVPKPYGFSANSQIHRQLASKLDCACTQAMYHGARLGVSVEFVQAKRVFGPRRVDSAEKFGLEVAWRVPKSGVGWTDVSYWPHCAPVRSTTRLCTTGRNAHAPSMYHGAQRTCPNYSPRGATQMANHVPRGATQMANHVPRGAMHMGRDRGLGLRALGIAGPWDCDKRRELGDGQG